MNVWQRALLGLGLGAICTLFFHPITRAHYSLGLWRLGDSHFLSKTPWVLKTTTALPEPRTLKDIAFWILIAANRQANGTGISSKELTEMLSLSQLAASEDPDNAFWKQSEAVFYWMMGEPGRARDAWVRASKCVKWNDLQSERLELIRQGLEHESGAAMAWQKAVLYQERSSAVHGMFHNFARNLLLTPGAGEDIELCLASAVNGKLIRDSARSIQGGMFGIQITDAAAGIGLTQSQQTVRDQHIMRLALQNRMIDEGLGTEALTIQSIYQDNESWQALISADEPQVAARYQCLKAVLVGVMPGCIVVVALFGLGFWLIGFLVDRFPTLRALFRAPIASIVGLLIAIGTYLLLHLPLISLWMAFCFALYSLDPRTEKATTIKNLDRAPSIVLISLGALFAACVVALWIGFTIPGNRLARYIESPWILGQNTLALAGSAAILLGLVLAIAPVWGAANRYAPDKVVGLVMRRFGLGLSIVCACIAILSGPIAIGMERGVNSELTKLSTNEPNSYLAR